jgi:hypothetical protein
MKQYTGTLLAFLAVAVAGAQMMDQDYGNYEDYAGAPPDDSLYADFAARQGREV